MEGDAIFARDMHGSGDPVDDVIQAWVVGGSVSIPRTCYKFYNYYRT